MKAILINPAEQAVEMITLSSVEEIKQKIGFDTVITDEVDQNGDLLHFDEECFLRGTEGRFQVDNMIPVSGIGVITGSNADGSLADVRLDVTDIRQRAKFIA